jgi:L-alanine-DL-glutamate epimerase-like enolase superfamily enzyme
MTPPRIRRATLYAADLALAETFQHASSGLIDTLNELVLKLESDDGAIGWGEMRGNNHYVTGDSPGSLAAILQDLILPRLLGQDATSPRRLADFVARLVVGNNTAKSLVDIAMHDLVARRLAVPVHALIGGARHARVHCHATLPFCPPDEAARRARFYLQMGFDAIKIRLGQRPLERDIERVAAVRQVLNDHPAPTILAADVNQGWDTKYAIRALRELRQYDLAWIEQPVPAADHAGLADIRRSIDMTLIADESCGTPTDMLRLLAADAVDGFHFKLCKAGGIGAVMRMVAIAESAGRPYMIGQMDEGMLATAAAVQCGLCADAISYELWGYQRVAAQPFVGLDLRDGHMIAPDGPGLGVTVDEASLRPIAAFDI